jgi:hypothetical protein
MTKPAAFSAVPDAIERMAREAAGESEAPTQGGRKLPVKASTKAMSVNMPKDVYDRLRDFWKLTDIPMTDVIVQGTIKELARLSKEHGV